MMKRFGCLVSLIAMMVMTCNGFADIAVTTASGLSFAPNSGFQQLGLFAQSTSVDPGTNSLNGFILVSGSGAVGFVEPSPFDFSGADAFSNIVVAGTSSQVNPGDSHNAVFSIEYQNPQLFPVSPSAPSFLGFFNFNVDGLAAGVYDITIFNLGADPGIGLQGSIGSFEITAVPEPGSIFTAGTLAIGGAFYGRRKWLKKKAAKAKSASGMKG